MWVESDAVPMAATAEQKLDLSFLSREETQTVLKVLERDRRLKMTEAQRLGRLFPGRNAGLKLEMKNTFPLQAQTAWCTPLIVPASPLDAVPVQANPPPLEPSARLSAEANTEGHADSAGDSSGRARKQPTLRSCLSSLLSIRFLQRSNSRYREVSNSSRDKNASSSSSGDIDKINRDVNTNSSNGDMDNSSRDKNTSNSGDINSSNGAMNINSNNGATGNTSSSSSSNRSLQVTCHGVSEEEQQTIRKLRETDQLHRRTQGSQCPDISRSTMLASSATTLLTQTAEVGQKTALLFEGTSFRPSPEHDGNKLGISSPNGTVDGPKGWGSEQQSTVGPETATAQLQCKAWISTELSSTDGATSPGDSKEQLKRGISEIGEKENRLSRGIDNREKLCSPTKDRPLPRKSDKNKDSREPNLSLTLDNTPSHCMPFTSEDKKRKEVNQCILGGKETENSIHCFSTENQKPNTTGHSPAWGPIDHTVDIHCENLVNTQGSMYTRQDDGQASETDVFIYSSPEFLKEINIDKSLTEKMSTIKASNKHVTSTPLLLSETEETRMGCLRQPTTKGNCFTPHTSTGTDVVGSAPASSAFHTERVPVWHPHLPHSHSYPEQAHPPLLKSLGPGRNHLDAVPTITVTDTTYPKSSVPLAPSKARHYPADVPLVKARSCERLFLKAVNADSPAFHSSPAPNIRSMSSSERINVLAKQQAQRLQSERNFLMSHGPQLPYYPKRGRCYSSYDISSSQHSQIPSYSSGTDNSRLGCKQKSLTTTTLPQHSLAKDEYPHQSKLSVFSPNHLGHSQQNDFRGDHPQCIKFSSSDNFSRNSLCKFDSLNNVNTNTDPMAIPIKKKRDYPPDKAQPDHFNHQEHEGKSDVFLTDITYKEYCHTTSYCKVKEKNSERWSSVSDLEYAGGNHTETQRHIFVEHHTKKQTFTKPKDRLLDSTGSQISLDWSSEGTDEDIFSISLGQLSEGNPQNYFSKYDGGPKPHHKSTSNVYQKNQNRANVDSYGSVGLRRGRSFSVTNISSNRGAGPRRISTGSRTATLADLRDCGSFDNAISHQPKTLSCTLDQTVSSVPVKRSPTTDHIWRCGSLASSSSSLLSTSQLGLDSSFPSSSHYLTYLDSEDSDSDSVSEGEYYLYGPGNDLETSL